MSARPITTPTATLIMGFPRAEADRSAWNIPLTATGADEAGGGSPLSTAAASAATRASERRRSSVSRCQANPPAAIAANTATIMRTNSTESTVSSRLPQQEFHRDLDEHVHRRPLESRRIELPFPDRLDRALIEAG